MTFVTHLECSSCHKVQSDRELTNLCECGMPLLVKYDLNRIRRALRREELCLRSASMWRYQELLPGRNAEDIVSLGEGFTPLIRAKRLASRFGLKKLWIKDESVNPTGSFKARGLSVAVTMARALGSLSSGEIWSHTAAETTMKRNRIPPIFFAAALVALLDLSGASAVTLAATRTTIASTLRPWRLTGRDVAGDRAHRGGGST